MNALRSTYCILMAITIYATGCIARRPDPNPLVGWKETRSQDPDKLAKAIRDDYLDYIEHLPPEEKKLLGMINFYEDRSGRHGVRMEIDLHGESWEHVLIYDQDNHRVQAIKRFAGQYGERLW